MAERCVFTRSKCNKWSRERVDKEKPMESGSEGNDQPRNEGTEESVDGKESNPLECAVCLQTCVLPARLMCGHIFCFLCMKGFLQSSGRCALCRAVVPREYLDAPHLLEEAARVDEISPDTSVESTSDVQYRWFYKGRDGWWKYEQRANKEIEEAHNNGDDTIELLIAGAIYVIDFQSMVQYPKSHAGRQRAIKRDLADSASKGVAGVLGTGGTSATHTQYVQASAVTN